MFIINKLLEFFRSKNVSSANDNGLIGENGGEIKLTKDEVEMVLRNRSEKNHQRTHDTFCQQRDFNFDGHVINIDSHSVVDIVIKRSEKSSLEVHASSLEQCDFVVTNVDECNVRVGTKNDAVDNEFIVAGGSIRVGTNHGTIAGTIQNFHGNKIGSIVYGDVSSSSGSSMIFNETPKVIIGIGSELSSISLTTSGSGSIIVEDGQTLFSKNCSISLAISGSGDIVINGEALNLNASLMGSGDIQASKLKSNSVNVNLMGSGSVECLALTDINVNAMGSGSVVVYGNPRNKRVHKLGIGQVSYV